MSGEDVKRELLRSIAERATTPSVSAPDASGVTAPDFRDVSREDVERELWLRHNIR